MGKKKEFTIKSIKLEKLVHGGQALAMLENGKKLFAWGGLPGETVSVRVLKQKKTYVEGIVIDVLEPSVDRVDPEEPKSYLSTSPWQIMSFASEIKYKDEILRETFEREGVEAINWSDFQVKGEITGYRNKMELSFWGDEDGLHLAHYVRGSHGKQIVDGSILANDCINNAANSLLAEISKLTIWGGKLKTLVLRSSNTGQVVAALFAKEDIDMSGFRLPTNVQGLDVYYSDPKSPASLASKKLYSFGDITLTDSIMGKNITYDVLSFFQVNLPVFELALQEIKSQLKSKKIVDMYSGVGTIGIAVGATTLVESDEQNIAMANKNIAKQKIKVVHATSESAVEHIQSDVTLIVDPPRAGLHKDVIARIAEVRPLQILYLSCNPSTQARDVKLLENDYRITYARGYNFFPRTPHIESLIVLELK